MAHVVIKLLSAVCSLVDLGLVLCLDFTAVISANFVVALTERTDYCLFVLFGLSRCFGENK